MFFKVRVRQGNSDKNCKLSGPLRQLSPTKGQHPRCLYAVGYSYYPPSNMTQQSSPNSLTRTSLQQEMEMVGPSKNLLMGQFRQLHTEYTFDQLVRAYSLHIIVKHCCLLSDWKLCSHLLQVHVHLAHYSLCQIQHVEARTCTCICWWLCLSLRLGLPEQAKGWLPLKFGIGSSKSIDKPFIMYMYMYMYVHMQSLILVTKHTCTCVGGG